MEDQRTRRAVLRTGVAGAFAATAGCSMLDPSSDSGLGRSQGGSGGTGPEYPDTLFRADVQRTGYWPGETVPDAVRTAWSVPGINKGDHTAAKASPLAYRGSIIVPGDVGTVFSYTPSGELEWATALHPSGFSTHTTPVIADGTLYTAGYDGAIYAIATADGTVEWRTVVADAIGSSPNYYDGVVYCATEFTDPSGGMVALDAGSGEVRWEDTRVTDHAHSQAGIDPETGTLATGSNDGNVYVWDIDTGEFRGEFETARAVKGPICIHDGVALFGSWDNYVYAVDVETLEARWWDRTDNDVMSGVAVHPDRGIAYVGGHDRQLHAYDIETGALEWVVDTDGWIVGSYDTTLYAVDAGDGIIRWTYREPDGWVTSSPAVYDGDVYVTARASDDTTGHLYKLSPA